MTRSHVNNSRHCGNNPAYSEGDLQIINGMSEFYGTGGRNTEAGEQEAAVIDNTVRGNKDRA